MLHQRQGTIPSSKRHYVEWQRGRAKYGLWLIELGTELLQRVEAAQEHLSDFLMKPYHRQPHISKSSCGFLTETMSIADDYSTE
jgi:hypothetical protein